MVVDVNDEFPVFSPSFYMFTVSEVRMDCGWWTCFITIFSHFVARVWKQITTL